MTPLEKNLPNMYRVPPEIFFSMNCMVGRQIINEIAISKLVLSDSIGGWPIFSFLRKAFFPLLVVYVLCDCHLTGVGSFFLRLSELILLIIITPNHETITLG